MNVLFRMAPVVHPVEEVTIILTAQEAKDLMVFFGHLSRNKVENVVDDYTSRSEPIYDLTSSLYVALNEGLK